MLKKVERYTLEDLDYLEELAYREARTDYWAFRQLLRPNMLVGWWQRLVAEELQRWWDAYLGGLRPKTIFVAPPQHGKSEQVVDFVSWVSGQNPDLRHIYAAFSDRLSVRANLRTQRTMDTGKYQRLFPETRLSRTNVVTVSGRYLRNRDILEFVDREGSFRNTTVNGPITGEGMDFGIIDDPLKGRKEANSPTIRQATWDWLVDDFFSRFSDQAGWIMMITRWHDDDPAGRAIEEFGIAEDYTEDGVVVLRYPALAEADEEYRAAGEPLFPELKSKPFLLARKRERSEQSWEGLYQGNPYVTGGGIFPVSRFVIDDFHPPAAQVEESVRYWDKAGTQDGGAYSAGIRMHRMTDGSFVIDGHERGQWAYSTREKVIKDTAKIDRAEWPQIKTYVEQEPGSGGKESAERTVAMLAGHSAYADRPTGSKEIRADPYSAQVQNGNVRLVAAGWNKEFKVEHELFPNGRYKDQVDAASGAFMKLTDPKKKRAGALF